MKQKNEKGVSKKGTPSIVNNRLDEYLSLAYNQIKIIDKRTNKEIKSVVGMFIKSALFQKNCVGYDKSLDRFYYVYSEGINEIGQPKDLIFTTANGLTYRKQADYDSTGNHFIIYGYEYHFSLYDMIKETTEFMQNCDIAKNQNVNACKLPYILKANESIRLSIEHYVNQQQSGEPCIVVDESLDSDSLKAILTGVELIADRIIAIRDNERDILLNKIGIITTNTNKKERVQATEINATINSSIDYIYSLIDNVNSQLKDYDIPYEMQFNGSLEELYIENDNDSSDTINKSQEGKKDE